MSRVDFECGGAISVHRDASDKRAPLVNVRAYGRSGTTLLLPLSEREVLMLVKELLTSGDRPTLVDWLDEINALAVTR